ncbi:MAG: methyltransferase domain-containing protein [Coriobacteriia bacterium]
MARFFRRVKAVAQTRLAALKRHAALNSVPVGRVDFGDLRRTEPISRVFGFDRGEPVDRYYIEGFLAEHASAIRGRVLEIGDSTYTKRFGGTNVTYSDVLHVTGDSLEATIVADLTHAPHIATDTFDCIILTQTLQFTYSMESAVSELFRILQPGGIVLCTLPGISQISRYDMDRWGDYWRVTSRSARELFETTFPAQQLEVHTYGNVLAAITLMHGLAQTELTTAELDVRDDDYQIIVAIEATKPVGA